MIIIKLFIEQINNYAMIQDSLTDVSFTNQFKFFAEVATIATLLFAVVTYWLNRIHVNKKILKFKKSLNTELRSIYFNAIIPDIISYEQLVASKYQDEFNGKNYDYPILDLIFRNDIVLKITKKHESHQILSIIYSLIGRTNNSYYEYNNFAPKTSDNKKRFYDFYFKHRIFQLRNIIIELSEHEEFIDLGVIPKEYIGFFPGRSDLKIKVLNLTPKDINLFLFKKKADEAEINRKINKYKCLSEQNTKAYDIARKYSEGPIRNIPEQYIE